MRIRAKLSLKNDHLVAAREAIGCFSQFDAAILVGTAPTSYGKCENFRDYPKKEKLISKYEKAFRLPFEMLFPKEYRDAVDRKLGRPITRVFDIMELPEHRVFMLPDTADAYEIEETKENLINTLDKSLDLLTEREGKVLKMRFGLYDGNEYTLEEVAYEFRVSRERIRQIEAKALRKLKHPMRRGKLKNFI